MLENYGTLKHFIDSQFNCVEDFIEFTKGVIIGQNCNGQNRFIFIESKEEISTYEDCIITHIEESDSKLYIIIKE